MPSCFSWTENVFYENQSIEIDRIELWVWNKYFRECLASESNMYLNLYTPVMSFWVRSDILELFLSQSPTDPFQSHWAPSLWVRVYTWNVRGCARMATRAVIDEFSHSLGLAVVWLQENHLWGHFLMDFAGCVDTYSSISISHSDSLEADCLW